MSSFVALIVFCRSNWHPPTTHQTANRTDGDKKQHGAGAFPYFWIQLVRRCRRPSSKSVIVVRCRRRPLSSVFVRHRRRPSSSVVVVRRRRPSSSSVVVVRRPLSGLRFHICWVSSCFSNNFVAFVVLYRRSSSSFVVNRRPPSRRPPSRRLSSRRPSAGAAVRLLLNIGENRCAGVLVKEEIKHPPALIFCLSRVVELRRLQHLLAPVFKKKTFLSCFGCFLSTRPPLPRIQCWILNSGRSSRKERFFLSRLRSAFIDSNIEFGGCGG